jgi:hypothetical protein
MRVIEKSVDGRLSVREGGPVCCSAANGKCLKRRYQPNSADWVRRRQAFWRPALGVRQLVV